MYSRDMPRQIVVPLHHLATFGAFLSFSHMHRALMAFKIPASAEDDSALMTAHAWARVPLGVISPVLSVCQVS
jgi:hypothetical protein